MTSGIPLVGRDEELARIGHLLDEARAGRSAVLAIAGEPGVGKSVLLERAVELGVGGRTLRARGVQSEAHIPFAGLADLLRPALFLLGRLPPPQAEALEGALALIPSRAQDRFAIGSATLSLLVALAEEAPVLVAVDDAQWIDGSSADALAFAFRRLVADPVAVLVTVRSGHSSGVASVARERMEIGGLDHRSASELVTAVVDTVPVDLLARLHRHTGGNPLALLEVARQLDAVPGFDPLDTPLPVMTSVSAIYLDRVRNLGPRAMAVVVLAASSDLTDLALLARAAGALGVDIADVAPAEEARLVKISDGRLDFRHPLIRSAVYNSAAPELRRSVHRALADCLPDRDIDRRAWHLALAALGPDPVASSALAQAAERALQRSAYEVAARGFERASQLAISEPARVDLLARAARSAWDAGLPHRAGELIDQTEGAATNQPVHSALLHLRGQIAIRQGPISDGLAQLLAAAEQMATLSVDTSVIILAEAVQAAFYAGDTTTMLHAAAVVEALERRIASQRTAFFAAMARGMADTFSGRTQAGAQQLRFAIDIAAAVDAPDDPQWHAWTALCTLWLRENGTSGALLERAAAVARSRTALGQLLYLLCYLAIDHASADRWAEAETGFHEVVALARETDQRTDLAAALARLAWVEARQGREQACRSHADEALSIAGDLGLHLCEVWAHAALGELHLALDANEAAAVHFTTQRAVLDSCGIADVDLDPSPELVELHLRSPGAADAVDLAVSYHTKARAKGLPWAMARAARARGLVAAASAMAPPFEEALRYHDQTPDSFETARTRLVYGSRLRRSRQRMRAREQLRAAIDIFDRLGARPWAAKARAELAATGERRSAQSSVSQVRLTPQELQISMLLTAGRTTRETAAALFLSPKTIEYHLRNVYRKLDCRDRQALAEALRDVRQTD